MNLTPDQIKQIKQHALGDADLEDLLTEEVIEHMKSGTSFKQALALCIDEDSDWPSIVDSWENSGDKFMLEGVRNILGLK